MNCVQMLHQLTARAVIRDWTDGSLSTDKMEHEVLYVCIGQCEQLFFSVHFHIRTMYLYKYTDGH